jgi:hypothetical protein
MVFEFETAGNDWVISTPGRDYDAIQRTQMQMRADRYALGPKFCSSTVQIGRWQETCHTFYDRENNDDTDDRRVTVVQKRRPWMKCGPSAKTATIANVNAKTTNCLIGKGRS